MTPDSIAETGAGASGWAIGSQTCSGTSASLTAKPAVNHQPRRAASATGSRAYAAASASNWNEPARAESVNSASAMQAAPACERAR